MNEGERSYKPTFIPSSCFYHILGTSPANITKTKFSHINGFMILPVCRGHCLRPFSYAFTHHPMSCWVTWVSPSQPHVTCSNPVPLQYLLKICCQVPSSVLRRKQINQTDMIFPYYLINLPFAFLQYQS